MLRLVALSAIIFIMQIFPMMQPRLQQGVGKRAMKGYTIPKKQLEQQMSEEQKKELEEAFMPDEQLKERRKQEATQKALKRIMASKEKLTPIPQPQQLEPIQRMSVEQKRELEEAFMTDEQLQERRKLERAQQKEQLLQQQRARQHPDKYFIHISDRPSEGIFVDKDVVKNTSKSLKTMIEDLGGDISAIPLLPSLYSPSLDIMKLAFTTLEKYKDVGDQLIEEKHININLLSAEKLNALRYKLLEELSLEQLSEKIDISTVSLQDLITLANFFNALDVPTKVLDLVLNAIKIDLKHDNEKIIELKMLHPDLQKIIMIAPTIDYLKTFIIKKYAEKRKKVLIDYPCNVVALAVSPDGMRTITVGEAAYNYGNELILWDISDQNNIKQLLKRYGQTGDYREVVFSPNGQQFVSAGLHLFLWNINNLRIPKSLDGHPSPIQAVAFMPMVLRLFHVVQVLRIILLYGIYLIQIILFIKCWLAIQALLNL